MCGAGVEPALDSFDILPASVCVMSPISEGRHPSVLPIEHTAHHAPIISSVRKVELESLTVLHPPFHADEPCPTVRSMPVG